MTWEYCVLKKDGLLGIHGVYYDEHGKIISFDADRNAPFGGDLEELQNKLKLMLKSLDKEIIDSETLAPILEDK